MAGRYSIQIEAMRKVNMGHKLSEETKRKIGEANRENLKGKTYEEICGSKEKADARRKKQRRKRAQWEKDKISKSMKGMIPKNLKDIHDKCHGKNHGQWKGGRLRTKRGYILIYCPDHPHANNKGYVFEHRLAMERHLGRLLLPIEVVHHKNKRRSDNRLKNLKLFSSENEHAKFERRLQLAYGRDK